MELSVTVDGGPKRTMTFDQHAPIGTIIRHVREIVEASRPRFEAVQFRCSRCGFEWTRQTEIGSTYSASPYSGRLSTTPPGGSPTYVNCPQCGWADQVRLTYEVPKAEADVPHWYKGSVALLAEADVALRRHVDRHGEWFEVFKSRDGIRLRAGEPTRSIADLHLKSGDRVLVVQA